MHSLRIALAGNPNCGKTCLFNNLTGSRQHVGNWPGVTVEQRSGRFVHRGVAYKAIDLPGTYALTAYSTEEQVVGNFLRDTPPDILVNVVDATNLEQHLVLTAQLRELGIPLVMALNMMDEARAHGIRIDIGTLSAMLGAPVVPMVARRNEGTAELLATLAAFAEARGKLPRLHEEGVSARVRAPHVSLDGYAAFAHEAITTCCVHTQAPGHSLTERLDAVLTRPVLGLVVFGLVMWSVFHLVFALGHYPAGWIADGFDALGAAVGAVLPPGVLRSLLVDGVIRGVGGVLVFLPNILFLFLAIGFMEDSGYMARAAFVTDGIMHRLGLHGKSIIPLLLGFGCTVPALMATRSLETRRARLATALMLPFMSCSARLPVYTLFISAFFAPRWHAPVLLSLYALGIVVAMATAQVFGVLWFHGDQEPLLIELPPYRLPTARSTLILMWQRAWEYVKKAGTVLLGASVVMWFLCTFPRGAADAAPGTPAAFASSYASRLGAVIEPLVRPLGFDRKIAIALVTGFAAKEAVVSTLGVIYGVEAHDKSSAHIGVHLTSDPVFAGKPWRAYALMVFVLLYVPCLGMVTMFWREFGVKWTLFMMGYSCAVAYVAALLVRLCV